MPVAALISLCLTVGLFILSLLFKVAGKLRLTLPVICFLLFATVLNPWAAAHEMLAYTIFFVLLGLTVLSWIVSLIKAIRRAREMGIPLDSIRFNAQGDLLDPRTGEPVVYGADQSNINR